MNAASVFVRSFLAASLALSAAAQQADVSSPGPTLSPRAPAQRDALDVCSDAAPLLVREIVDRIREAGTKELEQRVQLQQALCEQQSPTAPNALSPTALDSFKQWMSASIAYAQAHFWHAQQQARDLVDASNPTYADGKIARITVAGLLGGGYTLESTSFVCAPVGASYPTLDLNPGPSGPLSDVALFPWSFPLVDLSAQPDFVQSALGSANQPINDALFYSARSNGSLWHTGIAAPLPIAGSSLPLLVLFPTSLVGPERVLSAAEFALLRQLDKVLGGLDWPLVQMLIRPAFQPAPWSYSPPSDGAFLPQGGCATAWQCIVEASHRYRNAEIAAHSAYLAELDAARADFEADNEVMSDATNNILKLFGDTQYQGNLGGASFEAWMESLQQQSDQNQKQYDHECKLAADRRRAADCANLRQAKADVWNCTRDCPDYNDARAAFDAMVDTMLAQMGC
ncbi:MAG: hypothetical protein JNN27_04265 [Planctomycetes bacterium]|nr:hypothetical protein [Planctomycetota bacterium]